MIENLFYLYKIFSPPDDTNFGIENRMFRVPNEFYGVKSQNSTAKYIFGFTNRFLHVPSDVLAAKIDFFRDLTNFLATEIDLSGQIKIFLDVCIYIYIIYNLNKYGNVFFIRAL